MDKIVENRELSSMLADPSLLRDQAYIAGEWVSSKNKETFEKLAFGPHISLSGIWLLFIIWSVKRIFLYIKYLWNLKLQIN